MITFFAGAPLVAGAAIELPDDAAAHARARRIGPGEPARLLDGRGSVATGAVTAVEKRRVVVRVGDVVSQPRPSPLEVLVPVADKDRMLWAAEKCTELQVSAWRPCYYARSRSVSPRGEGARFREKVEARMRAALEQSGGAWLPEVHAEAEFGDAIATVPTSLTRLVLDSSGTSIVAHISMTGMVLAVGPEGGLEPAELRWATDRGWIPVTLGPTTLRFETAILSGVAIVRSTNSGR